MASVILEMSVSEAEFVLAAIRREVRMWGAGTPGCKACEAVADRLEAVLMPAACEQAWEDTPKAEVDQSARGKGW